MNENLYRESVTIRRPKAGTRQVDGSVEYEVVLGDGDLPVQIRCRIVHNSRRVFTTQNVEIQADATLLYSVKSGREILKDDIVVDRNGQAYNVVRHKHEKALFGPQILGSLDLQETTLPVQHDEEVAG